MGKLNFLKFLLCIILALPLANSKVIGSSDENEQGHSAKRVLLSAAGLPEKQMIFPREIFGEIMSHLGTEGLFNIGSVCVFLREDSEKLFEQKRLNKQGTHLLESFSKTPNRISYVSRKLMRDLASIYYQGDSFPNRLEKLKKMEKFFSSLEVDHLVLLCQFCRSQKKLKRNSPLYKELSKYSREDLKKLMPGDNGILNEYYNALNKSYQEQHPLAIEMFLLMNLKENSDIDLTGNKKIITFDTDNNPTTNWDRNLEYSLWDFYKYNLFSLWNYYTSRIHPEKLSAIYEFFSKHLIEREIIEGHGPGISEVLINKWLKNKNEDESLSIRAYHAATLMNQGYLIQAEEKFQAIEQELSKIIAEKGRGNLTPEQEQMYSLVKQNIQYIKHEINTHAAEMAQQ